MEGEFFIAALAVVVMLSWVLFCAASDICAAIKTPREIKVKLAEDDGQEALLWHAWALLVEAADDKGDEWNDKLAAWEVEYFGQDEDAK